MIDYKYIDTDDEMTRYLARLRETGTVTIAVDLEGEFNLHVYGERFCLLQVYDGHTPVVIDPFTVSANLVQNLLEDRNLLKITYDCTSDRLLLFKTHRILMRSILDLRPAAELLEYEKQDLKSVLDATLAVRSAGSKKRFQQYDWTRRPIDSEAISYALQDVLHLFALKDAVLERLVAAGQLEAFFLENLKRQDREPDIDRKPGVLRSGRFKNLARSQKDLFTRMHEIREEHAQNLDLPPNTVVSNNDLFALVRGDMRLDQVSGNRRIRPEQLQSVLNDMREVFGSGGGG